MRAVWRFLVSHVGRCVVAMLVPLIGVTFGDQLRVLDRPNTLDAHMALTDSGSMEAGGAGGCSPSWTPTFGGGAGVNGFVGALATFDDGTGPALYLAGGFSQTTDGATVNRIVKWEGGQWVPLGSGMTGPINALAVFDDGSGNGPSLFAGGSFAFAGGIAAANIARWDGSSWSPVGTGTNGSVVSLAVYDDGSGTGPALFAGGVFTMAGGHTVNRIAKWDGREWSGLAGGVTSAGSATINAIHAYDDGFGPALIAAGKFESIGGEPASNIAAWNGTSWSPLGAGVNGTVEALAVLDDIEGEALYVGGHFASAGGVTVNRIARWNGNDWAPLGTGVAGAGAVHALAVYDDGSGQALYVGGGFQNIGGVIARRIARWNGAEWSALGEGITGSGSVSVNSLHVHSGAKDAPALYAGGTFIFADHMTVNRVASWGGEAAGWAPLSIGLNDSVSVLKVLDDPNGGGPTLFAGGYFRYADSTSLQYIGRWNGESWLPLGTGFTGGHLGRVNDIVVFDDGLGDGPAIYASGWFETSGGVVVNNVAKWNGTHWMPLGQGVNGSALALEVFDDGSGAGPALYVAGGFDQAGGIPANRIARWDGTSWSAVGGGFNGWVNDLLVFDDGSGAALYAAGVFTTADGAPANRLARWNGSSWLPLGSGVNDAATVLALFDDGSGSGPALFVGGWFTQPTNRVAKWLGPQNPNAWKGLGAGVNSHVGALEVFDDGTGTGPALFVGGAFTSAGGIPANRLAKWDGEAWSPLGADQMNNWVFALAGFDDGRQSALLAGGSFESSPGNDAFLAKWQACPTSSKPLTVQFDIRPGSCPNPLNKKSQGVVPAAIVGTQELDVLSIDVSTLVLRRADGIGASIAPLNGPPGPGMTIEDVAAPLDDPDACACHEEGPDGVNDLALKFKTQDIIAELALGDLVPGQSIELMIDGALMDGTPFSGTDCVVMVGGGSAQHLLALLSSWGTCSDSSNCPVDLNGDGVVDVLDLLILLANWS